MRMFYAQRKNKFKKGFTLLEVLLSLAILSLLVGISLPIYRSFQVRNDLDMATFSIVQALRRAELLSQGVQGDSPWGIYITTGNLILYKGSDYARRDTVYDEITTLANSLTPSGQTEIKFNKFTGFPQSTGTLTLTSNTNESRIITINAKGIITY